MRKTWDKSYNFRSWSLFFVMRDVLKVVQDTALEAADKLLSYFTVQSQKCAFINFLLHLNNLESDSATGATVSSQFWGQDKSSNIFPNFDVDRSCLVVQHWPEFFHWLNLLRAWALFAESSYALYFLFQLKKKKKSARGSSLLQFHGDNAHSAWLSSPFWAGGERELSALPLVPLVSGPEAPEIRASHLLHETFGESGGLFTKLGLWGPSLSHSASSSSVEGCVAVGDGGRARHIQRAVDPVLSLDTKGRGLSFSQKCKRMNGAAGGNGHVFNCGKGMVLPHWCAVC